VGPTEARIRRECTLAPPGEFTSRARRRCDRVSTYFDHLSVITVAVAGDTEIFVSAITRVTLIIGSLSGTMLTTITF